jgi:hypothetical protein
MMMEVEGRAQSCLPKIQGDPSADLEQCARKLDADAGKLEEDANGLGKKVLLHERSSLRDQAALTDLLPKAKKEIDRLKKIAVLDKALLETGTTAVSRLGTKIADDFVTPKVRDRFQKEIQALAAGRIRVDLKKAGSKSGTPTYQIRLFANDKAKVELILSEGEQTCVALAAFLTELATADHKSTLVFDDPVTSLDHRWRRQVAMRLVKEAAQRQVIVFTHDLVFLNDIKGFAFDEGVENAAFSLHPSGDRVGLVDLSLPWAGANVAQRLDTLEKDARATRILFEANKDADYAKKTSSIYSSLRSTWERALEDIAFADVVQRHRDYIKTKDLMKVIVLEKADVQTFQKGFQKCSQQTEAHDPSRGRNAEPPPPDEVWRDIQELGEWVKTLRQRHKDLA